jgi:hypothetical protein
MSETSARDIPLLMRSSAQVRAKPSQSSLKVKPASTASACEAHSSFSSSSYTKQLKTSLKTFLAIRRDTIPTLVVLGKILHIVASSHMVRQFPSQPTKHNPSAIILITTSSTIVKTICVRARCIRLFRYHYANIPLYVTA